MLAVRKDSVPIRPGRLRKMLQLEMIAVLESLNQLRESPDFELCRIGEKRPVMRDELAVQR